MQRTSWTIKVSIILFWLVMMALLARKHVFIAIPVKLENKYLDQFIESREEWAGMYFKDSKVGYAHSEIKRIEDGYQIREDIFMDMSVMDVPQKLETSINAVVSRDLSLTMFSFRVRSGFISFIAYGTVEGTLLKLRTITGGKEQKKEMRLQDVPVLASSLKYYILKQGLAPGAQYSRTFFDPLTLSNRAVIVRVEGEEDLAVHGTTFRCYKLRQSFTGLDLYAWVDKNGETVKEESPMGLVLIKEDRQQALRENWGDRPDVIAATAVKVDQPFGKSGISYLRVRVQNIQIENFSLDGGRQSLDKDVVAIKLEDLTKDDTYVLPFAGVGLEKYLEATPLIQSNTSAMEALAQTIIGGNTDAQNAVRALTKWVYQNIEKRPTLSIPSALEVLRTKQGDCNEHAVLLAALCRATGIPTKVCAGLVYVKGSFYYHAWLEVYLKGWVSVDPTMNQFPADVTHIRFIEGDLDKQLQVLQLVGRLKLDILEHA